jgi:hypothetical protein
MRKRQEEAPSQREGASHKTSEVSEDLGGLGAVDHDEPVSPWLEQVSPQIGDPIVSRQRRIHEEVRVCLRVPLPRDL